MRPAVRAGQKCTHIVAWLAAAMLLSAATGALASVTVTLTTPTNGTTYITPPASIFLSATASASGGYTLSKVEFFRGSTLIGTDTVTPFSINWTNVPSGTFALTAKATATKTGQPNQTATSVPVNIVVNALPVVSLTSPSEGASLISPANITLNATVSDSDGTIASVKLFSSLSDVPMVTRTAPPYNFVLSDVQSVYDQYGTLGYFFYAVATDNRGAVSSSNYVRVTVGPAVVLISPANGANYTAPATIALSASVNPPGTASRVEIYHGTVVIGEASAPNITAPYTLNWENVGAGSYSLTAKAYDYGGGVWTSPPINVTVTSASTQLYFIHPDHLNTTRLIQDQAGNTVWRWDQGEPFGNDVPNNNPSGLGAFDFPLRFPGQYFDRETNLAYNVMRDYDPGIGSYVESDPIGLGGGINTYAYVLGDPLLLTDPMGLLSDSQCCRRSVQMGLDEGDAGWPICCEGRKVACTNVKPFTDSPRSASIMQGCLTQHERDHFPILEKCDCSAPGIKRLDARPGVDTNADECNAYKRTKSCIVRNAPKCGQDKVCARDLRYSLGEVERQIKRYCGGG